MSSPTSGMDSPTVVKSGAGFPQHAGSAPQEVSPPLDGLFASAYGELCELAQAHRRRWRGVETLNTTVLVHELYLKLSRQAPPLRNPACLLAVASRAMRHLLVNYAERQNALKRGGGVQKVPLATLNLPEEDAGGGAATAEEILELDRALEGLAVLDARQRAVVECRFFGGLSVEETAEALEVSTTTVKRDWRLARAWLQHELKAAGTP
jgi:RNA polymerase sigma factor (TIGR02999 family)